LPPDPTKLEIRFANIRFPVNYDVPEDGCLPLPDHYRIPAFGKLGEDVQHVAIALKHHRSLYIWGLPGSGKDATIHAWSWMTRTPAIIRQVKPGTDIESWFFSRGFNEKGTIWEEGEVLKALRDGYVTASGRILPYVVLITDLDRANTDQAEHLRLITDSIQGRVDGPAGHIYRVMPGTGIVATANTAGGGDERGRMVSSNPLDAALMDRFQRKFQFHWMEWEDEGIVVRAKFPILFNTYPNLETKVKDVTKKLREAVLNGTLHGEFSHRALCAILEHAMDIIAESEKKLPENLMGIAARAWLDGLPDEENRLIAQRVLDGHFKTLDKLNLRKVPHG
jgi:MoxR-like ATPase